MEDFCNVYRILVFRHNTVTAGSASQDGMLCVWDLLTGACMYSVQVSESFNQIPLSIVIYVLNPIFDLFP